MTDQFVHHFGLNRQKSTTTTTTTILGKGDLTARTKYEITAFIKFRVNNFESN